jgi:4-hydroxy-tetrahydrodipicolinate synthase
MERSRDLIDIAASFPRDGMRAFAGASRMDPDECVALANHAYDKGLDGVMIISPYYFPLTQEAAFDFYSSVASRTPAGIFIYNFPARTGYSVTGETALRLAERHANVKGFKDTVLDMWHTSELIKRVKGSCPGFEIFSGYDNNFAHNVLSGGDGCIGGLSNIVPEFFGEWIRALDAGDLEAVALCQRKADRMMDLYGIGDPFIPVIKKALKLRGVIGSDACLPPFRPADALETGKIMDLLETMGAGDADLKASVALKTNGSPETR